VNVTTFNGYKQFNSNIWQKSNWVVFDGYKQPSCPDMIQMSQVTASKKEECSYEPKATSYFKYSFHEDTEIPIIDSLRAWSA
jgi:hypothetical protein